MKLDTSDIADLRPLLVETVRAVLAEVQAADANFNGRIGLTENEAAAALGIAKHCLADARRRGEIHARRVGQKYIYARETLARYLAEGGSK